MRPVVRGLIVCAFWMGLALGFTSFLSGVLHDRHMTHASVDTRVPSY
jgi:hypothetical protein